MEPENVNATVSESREESLRKALELLQKEESELSPLSRPAISTGRTLAVFLIWLLSCCAAGAIIAGIGSYFDFPAWVIRTAVAVLFLAVIAFKAKSLICHAILLYQKHAPEKIRRSCLFTPTCSDYMLLSIKKYGVIKGCSKGIGRLCRCHHPNGGEDYP